MSLTTVSRCRDIRKIGIQRQHSHAVARYLSLSPKGPVRDGRLQARFHRGAFGVALLLPLVLYERRYLGRGGEPVFDLRLLTMRNVMVANFAVLGLLGITLANQAFVYKLGVAFTGRLWL